MQYWDEHPDHSSAEWQLEVANGDTRLGYWEWVAQKVPSTDAAVAPSADAASADRRILSLASHANAAANHYRDSIETRGYSDTLAAGIALAGVVDELASAIADKHC